MAPQRCYANHYLCWRSTRVVQTLKKGTYRPATQIHLIHMHGGKGDGTLGDVVDAVFKPGHGDIFRYADPPLLEEADGLDREFVVWAD